MKVFKIILCFIVILTLSCSDDDTQVVQEPPSTEEPTETPVFSDIELQIINWFSNQQLANGLIESVENGNIVSLYDNALAAMVFMINEDYNKAEKIFDFFDQRINTELKNGVGGFSQFRDRNGTPNGHRWMGDNAWLLIALNNYKAQTGSLKYDGLSEEISTWLQSLQGADGGLWAGYGTDNSRLNFKVTEGNIDAFNAIDGYTDFHSQLLSYLEEDRWLDDENNLVAWPTNPQFLYALDLHSWSYLIFEGYPESALTSAQRFLNTQLAFSGNEVTGYCFDEDKDTVWLEGTGQMALAFAKAGMVTEKEYYLSEMEKALLQSPSYPNAVGFAYTTNLGTTYGADPLWNGADTNIAVSGGAWYVFAKQGFNPFEVSREKEMSVVDKFWLF